MLRWAQHLVTCQLWCSATRIPPHQRITIKDQALPVRGTALERLESNCTMTVSTVANGCPVLDFVTCVSRRSNAFVLPVLTISPPDTLVLPRPSGRNLSCREYIHSTGENEYYWLLQELGKMNSHCGLSVNMFCTTGKEPLNGTMKT